MTAPLATSTSLATPHKVLVVRYEDHAPLEGLDGIGQCGDVEVQVVGRLVEHQNVRLDVRDRGGARAALPAAQRMGSTPCLTVGTPMRSRWERRLSRCALVPSPGTWRA